MLLSQGYSPSENPTVWLVLSGASIQVLVKSCDVVLMRNSAAMANDKKEKVNAMRCGGQDR